MTGVEEELRELLRERAQPPAAPAVRGNLVLARAGLRRQRRRTAAGAVAGLVLFAAFVATPLVAARGGGDRGGSTMAGGGGARADTGSTPLGPQSGDSGPPAPTRDHVGRTPGAPAAITLPAYLPAGYIANIDDAGLQLRGPHGTIEVWQGYLAIPRATAGGRQTVLARPVIAGRRGVLSQFPDAGVTVLRWSVGAGDGGRFVLRTRSTTLDPEELVRIARSFR